jgi:hypothetical protein
MNIDFIARSRITADSQQGFGGSGNPQCLQNPIFTSFSKYEKILVRQQQKIRFFTSVKPFSSSSTVMLLL